MANHNKPIVKINNNLIALSNVVMSLDTKIKQLTDDLNYIQSYIKKIEFTREEIRQQELNKIKMLDEKISQGWSFLPFYK